METRNQNLVLFVCKDNIYTKTLALILIHTFKVEVKVVSEIDASASVYSLLRSPDYVIVDLNSYSKLELEKSISFKEQYPETKLIALEQDEKPSSPSSIFDETIFKRKFYLGFSEVLKNNAPKVDEKKSSKQAIAKSINDFNYSSILGKNTFNKGVFSRA